MAFVPLMAPPTRSRVAAIGAGVLCVTMIDLRPFQKRFIKEATAPGRDTSILSLPRGN